jgi:hypothetical protein
VESVTKSVGMCGLGQSQWKGSRGSFQKMTHHIYCIGLQTCPLSMHRVIAQFHRFMYIFNYCMLVGQLCLKIVSTCLSGRVTGVSFLGLRADPGS